QKLIEEFIVVALVCALFLFHLRSAFVAIISLPLGILAAYIVMYYQGVNANIMSLGGIAIAVGAMVDAAVVMIENAHKHIEAWNEAHPGAYSRGATQSAESLSHCRLPAAARRRAAASEDDAAGRAGDRRRDRVAGEPPGRGIHAAARRRRSALHAHGATRTLRRQGLR